VLNNDTAVAGLDDATGLVAITTYAAAYSTGATQSVGASIAVAISTKTKKFFDVNAASQIASGLTNITVDAGSGNKFTAGGKITATIYYLEL
jgi:hypothetical protein